VFRPALILRIGQQPVDDYHGLCKKFYYDANEFVCREAYALVEQLLKMKGKHNT
jgi:hypothetical protein